MAQETIISADSHFVEPPEMWAERIDPAYRDGVKLNMHATANAARLVLEFELDDEAEPAPVFRA